MKRLALIIILLIAFVEVKAQSGFCRVYVPSTSITSAAPGSTISGKSFTTGNNIYLSGATHVHITHCKFTSLTVKAIRCDNCSFVTVDSCTFDNVQVGIYFFNCTGYMVANHNQFRNIYSNPLLSYGHAIQFNGCTGPGQQMNYNKCDIQSPSPYTGDIYNFYKSYGTSTSYMQMKHNWARGGGTGVSGSGVAGIIGGDILGQYQEIDSNICVNTGYFQAQIQGGDHINFKYNKLYSDFLPYSEGGLGVQNTGTAPAGMNDTIAYNQINNKSGYPSCGCSGQRDTQYKAGTYPKTMARPILWNTNIVYPASAGSPYNINASILPSQLFDDCTLPTITYATPLTYVYRQNVLIIPTYSNAVVSYTAASLPAGLSLNATTGVISGTVTAAQSATGYVITAHNSAGTSNYTITITVNKLPLVITADSKVKNQGQPNPTLTATYFGLYPGDTLTTPPTLSTTAVTGSPAGSYPITASGAASPNYTITYVSGILTVRGGHHGGGYKVIFRKAKLG